MPDATKTNTAPLTANQQAMLDLALACDLKASDANQHDTIRTRHKGIKFQRDAADYIREVENRVHSRRKYNPPSRVLKAAAVSAVPAKPRVSAKKKLTAMQTSAAIVLLLVLMGVAGWFAPAGANFVLVGLSMIFLLMVLGIATIHRPMGVFINERNLMDLSRFQMALWSVVVLSGFLTFAMVRIKTMAAGALGGPAGADPLGIAVDWRLWSLLGISTTSLVGTPLILSTKKDQEPDAKDVQKSAQMVNEPVADLDANKHGSLYANSSAADATLSDMFEGDEIIDTARIDLAKVQMFYFTVIAALCLSVMIFKMLTAENSTLDHLPYLPEGFIAMLGISHAGYLGSKTINRTQSQ